MINIRDLSKYSQDDAEKIDLIEEVLDNYPLEIRSFMEDIQFDALKLEIDADICEDSSGELPYTKYCPKCGEKYPEEDNICFDCLLHLKKISDKIDVGEIKTDYHFVFKGDNSYDDLKELLSADNLLKIKDFDLTYDDYLKILKNIKFQALKNFDDLVKQNKLDFDSMNILDKIILFSKSFVEVNYKSYGAELGYFEEGIIYIDDRQTKSLQITTLIHELSHFIIKEILIHILCRILNATKNSVVVDLVGFILSYSHFTQLIDEYCAHNVEGRFTMFGFQDYSSYIQIERSLNGEMSEDEIEITKSIGNTFAISIKDILEALIDKQLREDIKEQFLKDVLYRPNYMALEMENCQLLNEEGFLKAVWLILNDGCAMASAKLE